MPFPALAGTAVDIDPVFPTHDLGGWSFTWSQEEGVLHVAVDIDTPTARTIRLRHRP